MEQLLEKYELYLEWQGLIYNGNVALLDKALLYGPALKDAKRVNDVDSIKLDFTEQQNIFLSDPSFYVATLKWYGITYHQNDVIELHKCTLEHNKEGSLKNLTPDNFFIIDCELHEEQKHASQLVYQSWVLDNDGYPVGLE